MRLQNPLAVIGPSLDLAVLYVLARAEAEFTAPLIQKLLPEGGSLAGVRQALRRLIDQGIVRERISGRTRTYELNREHLVSDSVVAMASAKGSLIGRIRSEINSWEFTPLSVVLFGSAARDEMRSDSDIDLFIALPDEVDEDLAEGHVSSLAASIHAWTGNDARPLVYRKREILPAPIFDSIIREGLDLAGQPGWLRQFLFTRRVTT